MWVIWKIMRTRTAREIAIALVTLAYERLTDGHRSSSARSRRPRPWDEERDDDDWR